MTLRTLNCGNYGTVLIMGNAGFASSAVVPKASYYCIQSEDVA